MLVEIRNVGFVNKGAELMLYAILERMRKAYPNASYALAPNFNLNETPYCRRAELMLFQKASLILYGLQWGNLAMFVPQRIREMYGVVLDSEINIVLDASGFLYSDQWGSKYSKEMSTLCKKWGKRNKKIILMPQAFGPFTSISIRSAIKTIINEAALIFARDKVSYHHLTEVAGEISKIKIAPDFTNLLPGVLPDDFDSTNNRFCIVPNYRMLDKTDPIESQAYLPFLLKCTRYLLEKNKKPFILVHEGNNDLILAQKLSKAVGGKVPIIIETNPLKIKGIIGTSEGVIGSRFHSLVSALSQNIPTLATGWSHKYKMLFEDYGFSAGLINVKAEEQEIYHKIDLILNPRSAEKIKSVLIAKSDEMKKYSENMWKDIFQVINNN